MRLLRLDPFEEVLPRGQTALACSARPHRTLLRRHSQYLDQYATLCQSCWFRTGRETRSATTTIVLLRSLQSIATNWNSDSLATIRFPTARRRTFESPDQRSRLDVLSYRGCRLQKRYQRGRTASEAASRISEKDRLVPLLLARIPLSNRSPGCTGTVARYSSTSYCSLSPCLTRKHFRLSSGSHLTLSGQRKMQHRPIHLAKSLFMILPVSDSVSGPSSRCSVLRPVCSPRGHLGK
jgi:hypothetical protein